MVRMNDASDTASNTRAVKNAFEKKALVAVIAGKPRHEQSSLSELDQAY